MTPEQRATLAASCPVMTIEGRYLSGFNQCMLALQMPAATVVGGFRMAVEVLRAAIEEAENPQLTLAPEPLPRGL